MTRPTILLNPGPVTLTERVRRALTREDQCHREPEFAELMLDIKRRLQAVYPEARERFEAVVLSGSGTCAVEAMLSSFAPKTSKTLVMANGVYGERMAAMLQAHGQPVIVAKSAWTDAMDCAALDKHLQTDRDITHVVAVHNETTTGRLNDIARLAQVCGRYNARILLDAVSSFGGEEIDFAGWPMAAVAATANKCLHGVPGIAFVLADRQLLETGSSQSNTLYLDLFRYFKEQRSGFSPFTQAVHACFALQEALAELEEQGGWRARHARYRQIATTIRRELDGMGVRRLLDEDAYSSIISSFKLPEGLSYASIHDALRRAGFVIYAGQGDLAKTIFRISNMGDIRDDDLARLLDALRLIFRKTGVGQD